MPETPDWFKKFKGFECVLNYEMNTRKYDVGISSYQLFLITAFALLIITLAQPSFAITSGWERTEYNLNYDATDPLFAVILNYESDPGLGTITARITSDSDTTGIDLILNEVSPGVYKNTQLTLMHEDNTVSKTDSIIVSIVDETAAGADTLPGTPAAVEVTTSDFSAGILFPEFSLTSKPNVYEATINFGSVTDPATNTIAVKPGDSFTIFDDFTDLHANGFVGPNPDLGTGAIVVKKGDTVTAEISEGMTISTFTFTVDFASPPGGRGGPGGGLVPSIIVVDSTPQTGCSGDCTPPTLGLDPNYNRIISNGFSYNNNPIDVEMYYTPYPLITANVGVENLTVLKIYEDGGTQNIEHVGLAFGLGKGERFNDSKATISLDRTRDGLESVTLYDPENALDNVHVLTEEGSCNGGTSGPQCLIVSIYHTFREPLNFNMVATYVWDFKKNGWQNYYNHGIHIEGESLNPPKTKEVAFGEKNMRGTFVLTQIDKKQDLWTDDFGNVYLHKGNDRFDRIFSPPKEIIYDEVTMHGCNRTCNWFEYVKLHEKMLAEITMTEILDGKDIKSYLDEPFSYEFHILQRHEDPELQAAIQKEIERAYDLYKLLYEDNKQ